VCFRVACFQRHLPISRLRILEGGVSRSSRGRELRAQSSSPSLLALAPAASAPACAHPRRSTTRNLLGVWLQARVHLLRGPRDLAEDMPHLLPRGRQPRSCEDARFLCDAPPIADRLAVGVGGSSLSSPRGGPTGYVCHMFARSARNGSVACSAARGPIAGGAVTAHARRMVCARTRPARIPDRVTW